MFLASLLACRSSICLLLSWHCLALLTKHVCEAKLTDSVPVGYLALCSAVITARLEDLVHISSLAFRSLLVQSTTNYLRHHTNASSLSLLSLIKGAQSAFGQDEVPFVRIVLDWPSENHVALLKRENVLTLDKAVLKLELIQQIIPEVVLGENSSISKDYETVLGTCERNIQSAWVIQKSDA